MLNTPEVEVNVPALMLSEFKVTALEPKAKLPAPFFVSVELAEARVPPRVSVPLFTVICLLAGMLIVPAPRLRLFEPTNVKSAAKFIG